MRLFLNTADRLSGSTLQAPRWLLPQTIDAARSCHVASYMLPRDQDVINADNQRLTWTVGGVARTADLPVGIFDPSDLVSDIEDEMNAAQTGHTVVYDTATNKITFSHASALVFDVTSPLAPLLGFRDGDTSNPSGRLNLAGARWARLVSRELTRNAHHETIATGNARYDDLVCSFPIDAPRFGVTSYQPAHGQEQCVLYTSPQFIGSHSGRVLDISLYDETGAELTPTSNWQVDITFFCEQ